MIFGKSKCIYLLHLFASSGVPTESRSQERKAFALQLSKKLPIILCYKHQNSKQENPWKHHKTIYLLKS